MLSSSVSCLEAHENRPWQFFKRFKQPVMHAAYRDVEFEVLKLVTSAHILRMKRTRIVKDARIAPHRLEDEGNRKSLLLRMIPFLGVFVPSWASHMPGMKATTQTELP